jgi:NDP-sugar pyrophosphorylase family protein
MATKSPAKKKAASKSSKTAKKATKSTKKPAKKTAAKKTTTKKPSAAKKVAKKTPAKKVRYQKTEPPTDEILDRLIKKGRLRGFITENEILHTFPEVEDYLPMFEEYLERIEKVGVHFIEMK